MTPAEVADHLLDGPIARVRPVGGGCVGTCAHVTLTDGTQAFVKTMSSPPEDIFTAEAEGLRWLADAGAVPVPDVLAVDATGIALAWVPPGRPSTAAAAGFGRSLAALHLAGAPAFGAPWPGRIGPLPMDNTSAADWPTFYAEQRLLPNARLAYDRGGLSAAGLAAVEAVAERCAELAGPAEPPARLHGDLWSGNLHWGEDDRCWLIDPAAHGGHRETDLAMLALFGAPHLDTLLTAYADGAADLGRPLDDGWRARVPLHQLWPLLVHAALFGAGYGAQAASAADSLL